MIVKIQNLLVLLLLLGVGHSAKAFDLAGQFRNYTCMKNENF